MSLEVAPGEVLGVIGHNGAGKSTLLKILSRITEPTEGRAEVRGRVGSLLEVGTGFHPELTGRENIFLNGAILGMKRAEIARRFDEMVAFAEVERFIDTPVKRYSSGMYLRLAFAVAAHLEPEILLVDEVLAVGDAAFQKKCLGRMSDVAREGRTVLFVSHNLPSIEKLCQRVIVVDGGRLVMQGDPVTCIATYLGAHAEPQPGRRPGGGAAARPAAGARLYPAWSCAPRRRHAGLSRRFWRNARVPPVVFGRGRDPEPQLRHHRVQRHGHAAVLLADAYPAWPVGLGAGRRAASSVDLTKCRWCRANICSRLAA